MSEDLAREVAALRAKLAAAERDVADADSVREDMRRLAAKAIDERDAMAARSEKLEVALANAESRLAAEKAITAEAIEAQYSMAARSERLALRVGRLEAGLATVRKELDVPRSRVSGFASHGSMPTEHIRRTNIELSMILCAIDALLTPPSGEEG